MRWWPGYMLTSYGGVALAQHETAVGLICLVLGIVWFHCFDRRAVL